MKLQLSFLLLVSSICILPSAVESHSFSVPEPSPVAIIAVDALFESLPPSAPHTFPVPSDPSHLPLASYEIEAPVPSDHPEQLVTASNAAQPIETPIPTEPTEPPIFDIITCTSNDGCNAGDGRRFTCRNSQINITPDNETTVLLLSEFDQLVGWQITFRATVPRVLTISGPRVALVSWISTENDVEQTICAEPVLDVAPTFAFPESDFSVPLLPSSIGRSFGTCCRPCPLSNVRLSFPPSLSCCSSCGLIK
ncbi:unnamed protein product [Agarophyton chilense]